jgi:hypothetical protein
MTRFSGTCYSLLSLYDVQQAVGHRIPGKTAFVVGLPDKNIGRLGYLNCRYGIPAAAPGASATPQIEIGVTLYDTPAQAQRRVTGTIQDYVANGATSAQVSLAGQPAVILTGGSGTGYTVPLLVAASGQRTVAVSLDDPATSAAQRTRILSALATLALNSTGG